MAAILIYKGRHIIIVLKSTFYKGLYIIFLTSQRLYEVWLCKYSSRFSGKFWLQIHCNAHGF